MAKSNDPAGIRREQRAYKALGYAGAGRVYPPTDRQIAFAQSLAGQSGDVIPSACLVDGKAMQHWLSARLGKDSPEPGSRTTRVRR